MLAGIALLGREDDDHHAAAPDVAPDAAAGADAIGAAMADPGPDHHDPDDSHRHGPLPWLLVAPFVVVFAIGPAPLGSFMAGRQPDRVLEPAKFQLSCCAADGSPVRVRVHGIEPLPVADTWLRIEGYWLPHEPGALPDVDELRAESWEEIPVPDNPYL